MSDYIKRDDALNIDFKIRVGAFENRKTTATNAVQAYADAIARIPSEDVRPVVRGHWITEEEAEAKGDYSFRDACSVCGRCDWDCTESASFNYCPNCGADMREKS